VDYIRPGSPADLSCKIFVGDEVVSMNGKSLHGMQVHFFFFILSFIFYFY
jgi:C-terminal processing protease CtpA/Prc